MIHNKDGGKCHKFYDMREQGVAEAERVILQLDKFPIQIVEVNKDFAYEAARLRGKYRIAYADCFAVALSVKLNTSLDCLTFVPGCFDNRP